MAHPASQLERPNRQEGDRHLPVQEGSRLRGRQGADAHSQSETSNACRPPAPVEPDAAGLVQLLPSWRVLADLQLRRPLRLLADRRLAPQTTRRTEHAHPGSSLPSRVEFATGGRDVPALHRQHRAVPVSGRTHPHTMEERVNNWITRTSGMNTWRAGCSGSCTPDPYTHASTWQGMGYVCFIVDAFSRMIVGWRVAWVYAHRYGPDCGGDGPLAARDPHRRVDRAFRRRQPGSRVFGSLTVSPRLGLARRSGPSPIPMTMPLQKQSTGCTRAS